MKSEKDKQVCKKDAATTMATTTCPDLSPTSMEATGEKLCEYCERPIGANRVSRDGFDFCSAECSEQSRDSDTCKHCEKPIDGEPVISWPLGHTPSFFCSVTCQQKFVGAKR